MSESPAFRGPMYQSLIHEHCRQKTNPQERTEREKCFAWVFREVRIAFTVKVRYANDSPIFKSASKLGTGDVPSNTFPCSHCPFNSPEGIILSVIRWKEKIAVVTLYFVFQELLQHQEIVAKDTWKYCLWAWLWLFCKPRLKSHCWVGDSPERAVQRPFAPWNYLCKLNPYTNTVAIYVNVFENAL